MERVHIAMAVVWDINETDFLDLAFLEKEIAKMMDHSNLQETLKLQMAEFDMLQAMYSNPGELCVDDHSVFVDFNDFLEGKTANIPPQLNFTVNLVVDEVKFEVYVNFPLEYPNLEPDIFVRSSKLNRSQQQLLNGELAKYVSDMDRGELCICSAVMWLQENALQFIATDNKSNTKLCKLNTTKTKIAQEIFSRLWIYSHHIYSKAKRRELLDLAQDFSLSGFCLPGRPGIICIEGSSSECEDYWQKVKGMNWKKIVCSKKEEENLKGKVADNLRKFTSFQEVSFEGTKVKGREYHMDFGEFYKYLVAHNCEYAFKDLFGIDGKVTTAAS